MTVTLDIRRICLRIEVIFQIDHPLKVKKRARIVELKIKQDKRNEPNAESQKPTYNQGYNAFKGTISNWNTNPHLRNKGRQAVHLQK